LDEAMNGIIGRKLGMSRFFREDGHVFPVTVIEAGPCAVVQVRAGSSGGHQVQLAFGARKPKRVSRAEQGHVKPVGLEAPPAALREFRVAEGAPAAGATVTVGIFAEGDRVKVTGTTKGRGFQGVVKRHGFAGGPASHGNTRHRKPGSIGPGTNPSRVLKGKKMPGHHGAARHTETGLQIVKIDPERNLLFVRGAVPGPTSGLVIVRKQVRRSRYA
jgi:large subunit ribosomal protein L3